MKYRGQSVLRNKDGVEINRARWELSPAELERPDAKQNCQVVGKHQSASEAGSGSTVTPDGDTVLRCSTGKMQVLGMLEVWGRVHQALGWFFQDFVLY